MDAALFYHRFHFAFTITYHYIFPQLTMGLALLIVLLLGLAAPAAAQESPLNSFGAVPAQLPEFLIFNHEDLKQRPPQKNNQPCFRILYLAIPVNEI